MRIRLTLFSIILFSFSCTNQHENNHPLVIESTTPAAVKEASIVILGTVQDAGSPHIGCQRSCCEVLFSHPDENRMVVSLGIIDPKNKKKYLLEATPDLPKQMKLLKEFAPFESNEEPDGIFLTHAHIGHYTGLMYFGREALGAKNIPVFAMPQMASFLQNNGPWEQLVQLNNIKLTVLENNKNTILTDQITITPFKVPHRDEYSETVGYSIKGPNKRAIFIPDIDKWEKWSEDVIELIKEVDYAFLDATFFDGEEINNRDISEIPHPFIIESIEKFKELPPEIKDKIYFIHFNHTNPVLNPESKQFKSVENEGFHIAQVFDTIVL